MPRGRPPSFETFTCPHCRAKAGPETNVQVVACLVCFGALTAREGSFVLKIFSASQSGTRGMRSDGKNEKKQSHAGPLAHARENEKKQINAAAGLTSPAFGYGARKAWTE
jgi:hypothetical protein